MVKRLSLSSGAIAAGTERVRRPRLRRRRLRNRRLQTTPAQAQPWKKIAIPPLHAFKPEQPKRIELANGLVIFLAG